MAWTIFSYSALSACCSGESLIDNGVELPKPLPIKKKMATKAAKKTMILNGISSSESSSDEGDSVGTVLGTLWSSTTFRAELQTGAQPIRHQN